MLYIKQRAIHYGREKIPLPAQLNFKCLEAVKFQNVITAEDYLELQLEWDQSKLKLKYKYLKAGKPMSSGRIVFADNQAEQLDNV